MKAGLTQQHSPTSTVRMLLGLCCLRRACVTIEDKTTEGLRSVLKPSYRLLLQVGGHVSASVSVQTISIQASTFGFISFINAGAGKAV